MRPRVARAAICPTLLSALALLSLGGWLTPALAQESDRFAVEVEGGGLWLGRNDVRIPNDPSATEFSLVDAVGRGPSPAVRASVEVNLNERHGLRFVAAPLRIDQRGMLATPVSFAGETFSPGAVDATYQFSSYRATYRYRFFNGDRWQWRVGFTGFVRDARVALSRDGRLAEDTDVGFVPLLHLQGRAALGPRWSVVLDVDGLAATQGRAFDVAATLAYAIDEHWQLAVGYRTIEGGADVDDVFNFAWLNFAVASVRYGF